MALDHFVSQVHLRKFYATALNRKKMYAWRKSNLDHFISDSRDVCRIPEGSTNPYFAEPRAVEEFLRLVEPRYNRACSAALRGNMEFEDVFSLAGFGAFVTASSPTAVRLGQGSIAALAESDARLLDESGMLERSPKELGHRSLSQLLDDNALAINIDGKFAQAVGIGLVLELTNGFANTPWDFVRNPFEDSPFLTSDFPVALAARKGELALRRFIPVQPDLGVFISPSKAASGERPSTLKDFRWRLRTAKRSEVHALNRLIVQCAEDMVFSNVDASWIARLVEKNAKFAVMNTTGRLKTRDGYYTFSSLGIREREG